MIVSNLLIFLNIFFLQSEDILTKVNHDVEIHIFNYEFDEAYQVLKDHRDDISPYRYNTYKSVINFYRYYSDQPSKRRLKYVDSMAVALNTTFMDEAKILESKNSDDILMLGGAYGFRGMAKFIKKDRISALLDADEAKDILVDLIEQDPNAKDAYFGIGIYNYALSQPPAFLQFFLMMLGFSGDYDTGIEQLNIVAKEGSHTKVQSILYLINHALYEEDHFEAVYPIFAELPDHIQKTPMTLYKKIQFEYHLKHHDAVHQVFRELNPMTMPPYIRNYARFTKAQSFIETQQPDSALKYIHLIETSRDYFMGGLRYDLRILKGDYHMQKKEYDKAYELYRRVLINTTNDERFEKCQNKIRYLSKISGREYQDEKDE